MEHWNLSPGEGFSTYIYNAGTGGNGYCIYNTWRGDGFLTLFYTQIFKVLKK